MKETIRQNASLEALSKKSFKKYLKSLIKDKAKVLDRIFTGLRMTSTETDMTITDGGKGKLQTEYYLLCQVLDDYKYYQARKKDLKKNKGDSCRI